MNGLSGMPPSLMAGICTGAALAILLLLIGAVWSLIERRRTAQAHEPIVMIELGHVDGVVVDTEDEEEEGLGLVELTDMVPMPPPTPMPPPLPTPPAGAPLVKQGPGWAPSDHPQFALQQAMWRACLAADAGEPFNGAVVQYFAGKSEATYDGALGPVSDVEVDLTGSPIEAEIRSDHDRYRVRLGVNCRATPQSAGRANALVQADRDDREVRLIENLKAELALALVREQPKVYKLIE